jgi:acetate kinase
MNAVLEALQDPEHGVIKSIGEISAVGHRVLHGGEKFTASTVIDGDVMAAIEEYIPLGPLHNPANLMGIRACQAVMPDTPMVAVFDTAFHQTMPPKRTCTASRWNITASTTSAATASTARPIASSRRAPSRSSA